jgi:hypothetical protein
MLAASFEGHDTIGQWMAHHLAELVAAAQDDATTTVEQRQQIMEAILKVWAHRCYYPRKAPLEEFSSVFMALDRLGDSRPWKFSQLFNADTEILDPSTSGLPLIATAAELERLARETLLRLIWLAAQDAKEKNQEWLEVADKVASNMESEVTTTLSRLRRQLARHRLRLVEGDPNDLTEIAAKRPAEDAGAEGEADNAAEGPTEGAAAEDIVENGAENGREDPLDDEDEDDNDESDPLGDINHVKRLREMAALLNKVADTLTLPEPPE